MRSSPDNSGPTSAQLEAHFRYSGAIDRIRKATEARLHTTASTRTARTLLETQRMIAANPDSDARALMARLSSSVMPEIEKSIKNEVASITAPENAEWLRNLFRCEYNRAIQMERDHLFSRTAQAAASSPGGGAKYQISSIDNNAHQPTTQAAPFVNPSVAGTNSQTTGKSDASVDPALQHAKKPTKHSVQTFLKTIKRTSEKAARSRVNRSTPGFLPSTQYIEGTSGVDKKTDKATQQTVVKQQKLSSSTHTNKESSFNSKHASPKNMPHEGRTPTCVYPPSTPTIESQNPLVHLANAAGMNSPHNELNTIVSAPHSNSTPRFDPISNTSRTNVNASSIHKDPNSPNIAISMKVEPSYLQLHDKLDKVDTAASQSPHLQELKNYDGCLSRAQKPVIVVKPNEIQSHETLGAPKKGMRTFSEVQASPVIDPPERRGAELEVSHTLSCPTEKKYVSSEFDLGIDNSVAKMQLAKELISFKENCQKNAMKSSSFPVVAKTAEQEHEFMIDTKASVLCPQYPVSTDRSPNVFAPPQSLNQLTGNDEKQNEAISQPPIEKSQSEHGQDQNSESRLEASSTLVNLERNPPTHVVNSDQVVHNDAAGLRRTFFPTEQYEASNYCETNPALSSEKSCDPTIRLSQTFELVHNSRNCSDPLTSNPRNESLLQRNKYDSLAFRKKEITGVQNDEPSTIESTNDVLDIRKPKNHPLQPMSVGSITQGGKSSRTQFAENMDVQMRSILDVTSENYERSEGTTGGCDATITAERNENRNSATPALLSNERKSQINKLEKCGVSNVVFDFASNLTRFERGNETSAENVTDEQNVLSKTLNLKSNQILADGGISAEKECILPPSEESHVSIQDAVRNSQTVLNLQSNATDKQVAQPASDEKDMPPKPLMPRLNKPLHSTYEQGDPFHSSAPRSDSDSRRTGHAKLQSSTPSSSSLETRRSPALISASQGDISNIPIRKRRSSKLNFGLPLSKKKKVDDGVEETGREKLVAAMLAQMADSVSAEAKPSTHLTRSIGSASEGIGSSKENFEYESYQKGVEPRNQSIPDETKSRDIERTEYLSASSSSIGKEDIIPVENSPRRMERLPIHERLSTERQSRAEHVLENLVISPVAGKRDAYEGRDFHSKVRDQQGAKRPRNRFESLEVFGSSSSRSSPFKKRRPSASDISEELNDELLEVSGSHIEDSLQNYGEARGSSQLQQAHDFNKQEELLRMLQRLMKTADAAPFLEPVEHTGEFGMRYHSIIKHPMDLGTISRRLASSTAEKAYYRNTAAALEDVELVWSNCRTFNPMYDEVTLAANRCADELNKMLGDVGLVPPSRTKKVRRRASQNTPRPLSDVPRSTISKSPRKKSSKPRKTSGKRLNQGVNEGRNTNKVSPAIYPDNDGRLVGKQIAIFAAVSGRVKAWYRVKVLSHESASSSYTLQWLDDDDNITTGATFGLQVMYPVYRV